MTGWVIVVLQDGFADPQVLGDQSGNLFPSEAAAEEAARVYPRRGASYSVYLRQIGRG